MFQSTHPYWVRHIDRTSSKPCILVSIHAPVLGATLPPFVNLDAYLGFNPRTRIGCDLRMQITSLVIWCFNPRTRIGCDIKQVSTQYDEFMFQSTHPYWVRRTAPQAHYAFAWFQSTHPYWVRHHPVKQCHRVELFQSTHPYWVRRANFPIRSTTPSVSIHAPVLGATVTNTLYYTQ